VVLLVVIDSSENLENPEKPKSRTLGPLNSTSTGCDDDTVAAAKGMRRLWVR
jgi:hypothetical protein